MKNSLIQRLTNQPDSLTLLLHGITEAQIRSRPLPEKWSIYENIVHLGRYHEVFRDRMIRIVNTAEPEFQSYKAENDQGFYDWQQKSFTELMNDFREDRHALNNYLTALPRELLQRTARHPVYGRINMEGWTELFLLHEAHHFFTIAKLAPLVNNTRVLGVY